MKKLRLICWNAGLAKERAKLLRSAGFAVDSSPMVGSGIVGQMRDFAPDAVVIDLDRLPSHGREMAILLRGSKATRHIPLVLAGGVVDKVARIRGELPDAVYAVWDDVAVAVKKALANPPRNPVGLTPHMQLWSSGDLVRKLGITADMNVAMLGAPDRFEDLLGDLPAGVAFATRLEKQTKLALYFVRSSDALDKALEHLAGQLPPASSVWMIHPKRNGKSSADFNQNDVRDRALPLWLVDYKVCSVSDEWSGLKFAWRRK